MATASRTTVQSISQYDLREIGTLIAHLDNTPLAFQVGQKITVLDPNDSDYVLGELLLDAEQTWQFTANLV